MEPTIRPAIRPAVPQDDPVIAQHFYQMWRDLDVPEAAIAPDWLAVIQHYIQRARSTLDYQAFVAEIDRSDSRDAAHTPAHTIIGSVGCQRFAGLYPEILTPDYRLQGYIWGVYVEPAYRRQGLATLLTQTAVDYLKGIGCTRAVLNASPLGRSVYTKMGFVVGNAMHLDL